MVWTVKVFILSIQTLRESVVAEKVLLLKSESNMHKRESVILTRDCDAYLVPSGTKVNIPKNSEVIITQALGGSFTVSVYGNLARIDGLDADALGKEVIEVTPLDVP